MAGELRAHIFGHSLYHLTLRGPVPHAVAETPPGLWPGNPEKGRALIAAQADDGVEPPWSGRPNMHGFEWIFDLIATGQAEAKPLAARLTSKWLSTESRWQADSWRADRLGRRLSSWLIVFDYLVSGNDVLKSQLLHALTEQSRHLNRVTRHPDPGSDRIQALKGLIHCSLALPEREKYLPQGMRLLAREITRQVLPDGCHVDRNPSHHLGVLAALIEIRAALIQAHIEVPEDLQGAIDRMAPMLRSFRHGDGGLALFNGAREEDDAFIDLVLRETGSRAKALSSAPHGGFHRLKAQRTLVILEAGEHPRDGHAGTLSFELSIGKRRLVVNCGAAAQGEALWHEALRRSAAHSTLIVDDTNSAELTGPAGPQGRRPEKVRFTRREIDRNLLLEASHDGYAQIFDLIHKRSLYVAAEGDDLRGEDCLSGPGPKPFAIRFHLHPSVQASLIEGGRAVLLKLSGGQGWWFRTGSGEVTLEESVYLGSGLRRRCQQIVVSGNHEGPETIAKWRFNRESRQPKEAAAPEEG